MNIEDYTYLLKNSDQISVAQTLELEKIIEAFPYFQSARVLYLKGLKNQNSFKYNQELKKTAAHTTDRSILFDVITTPKYIQQSSNEHTIAKTANKILASEKAASPEEILSIGKPLEFSTSESHSFNEWLQLNNTIKPIEREEKQETKEEKQTQEKSIKSSIIDKFIASNPKIKPIKENPNPTITNNDTQRSDDQIMTETLAKVYLEQKKYEYAIKAYRILSLKYPEKSSFFADQIKAIKNLEKK